MDRRDISRNLFSVAVGAAILSNRSEGQTCVAPCWAQTSSEAAAGVVPTNTSFRPGDWRRYGADPTGSVDSTVAIANSCKANAISFDESGGTYLVGSASVPSIVVPSGVTVQGAGFKTILQAANGSNPVFSLSGAGSVCLRDLKITCVAVGTTAVGAIHIFNSTNVIVENCEIVTGSLWGVALWDSKYCTVSHCYIHNTANSQMESSDIIVYNNSSYNVISENQCFGGINSFGIMIQDPYSTSFPSKNVVSNNRVGQHSGYGIACYLPDAADTYNQILGNYVENIQGTALSDGSSGAGIYVVGAGAGGTEISGNNVRNCCVQTSSQILAPAGIGVNGLSSSNAPVSVVGNQVDAMPKYNGILVTSSAAVVNVTGNSVRMPAGNSTGSAIMVENSSAVNVSSNITQQAGSGRCILFYASAVSAPLTQLSVVGNTCVGAGFNQIDFSVNGTVGFSGVVCANNSCRCTASVYCISLYLVDHCIVSGNVCSATTAAAFWANTSTQCRILGNSFSSTGTTGAGASGTCTGWYDKSNVQTGSFVGSGITIDT